MLRLINTVLVVLMLLVGLVQFLAITAKHNIYDEQPTRCGRGLREVCPPTGINWGR